MTRCVELLAIVCIALSGPGCTGVLSESGSEGTEADAGAAGASPGRKRDGALAGDAGSPRPAPGDASPGDAASPPDEPPAGPSPCDFDGDGRSDVGGFDPARGFWHFHGSRDGAAHAVDWGWRLTRPVPADFDGDGRTDPAVYRPATGEWHARSATPGWDSARPLAVGPPGSLPAPADYDGDGAAELAVYDHRALQWHTASLSERDAPAHVLDFGLPRAVPTPGDFDGDGVADRAVYQPSRRRWSVRLSSDRATLDFELGVPWGRVVVGDYDGDGRDDAASYDPHTGAWEVRPSGGGAAPAPVMLSPGGVPLHLDVDGDGVADPALFRRQAREIEAWPSGAAERRTFPLPPDARDPLCPAPLQQRGGRVVMEIGEPVLVRPSRSAGALSLALDRLEQPHLMTDRNDNAGLNLYSRVGGRWTAIEPVLAREEHGPRYPALHIDGDDRGWFSSGVFRASDTEVTSGWVGLLSDMVTGPALVWTHKISPWITFGGRIAVDPHSPGQAWHLTSWVPYELRHFDVGGYVDMRRVEGIVRGTRTIDFAIAAVDDGRAPGVMHVATAVSYDRGAERFRPGYWNSTLAASVTWNARLRSDGVDSDSTNASLGLDETSPEVAYMAAFTDDLKVNVWDGGALVFGDAPRVVDPAPAPLGNGAPYFGPQWATAAGGGAFLCWTGGGRDIRLQHFDAAGQPTPPEPLVVGPGSQCDVVSDFRGDLYLAYVADGLHIRRVFTR